MTQDHTEIPTCPSVYATIYCDESLLGPGRDNVGHHFHKFARWTYAYDPGEYCCKCKATLGNIPGFDS